jgi:hypothetical protein
VSPRVNGPTVKVLVQPHLKPVEIAGDKENQLDSVVMQDESLEPTILLADHFEFNDTTMGSSII